MSNTIYFIIYVYFVILYGVLSDVCHEYMDGGKKGNILRVHMICHGNNGNKQAHAKDDKSEKRDGRVCFFDEFAFGVATAAYQIEGSWNASGKGESIWDRYTHQFPDRVFDHKNADEADDSYKRVKEDIAMLTAIGVNFYRFSISWPRILPKGLSNEVNHEAIKYYKELIDDLFANKIAPVVTMFHWDLPQCLQDIGGWANPIVADYFVDYARVLLDNFGDKVKVWLTFNEPLSFCHDGYGGLDAPGTNCSGFLDYLCGHNVLRAHGMVYRMFDTEYRKKNGGHMGITVDFPWMEPASTSAADETAAETARQFMFGWFTHPIFSTKGDYPPIMRTVIDANSKAQGYQRSRLPQFTPEEVKMIKGSADYMGLNQYTSYEVKNGTRNVSNVTSFEDDMNVEISQKEEWPKTNSTWLRVVPWGLRKALNWIRLNYSNPTVLVTENGVSYEPGINDTNRIAFIDAYLRELHEAIHKDGCSVIGYTYWSLMDNFEWMRGFSERFGLYEVDYESANFTRTPRDSAKYYTEVSKTGCLPETLNDNCYFVDLEPIIPD